MTGGAAVGGAAMADPVALPYPVSWYSQTTDGRGARPAADGAISALRPA